MAFIAGHKIIRPLASIQFFLVLGLLNSWATFDNTEASGEKYLAAAITKTEGRVECIRSRTTEWQMLRQGHFLGQNDKVVVHPDARVEGAFPEGSEFILREDSKLLFNSSPLSKAGQAHKVYTLYKGAAYITARKSIWGDEGKHTKVFMGSLAMVFDEGGLLVEYEPTRKKTFVAVLGGTLQVFNSAHKQELFVQNGNMFTLDSTGKVLEPEEIQNEKFFQEYSWMDPKVLEDEMYRGMLILKRKQDIIAGRRLGKVVIREFEAQTPELQKWGVEKFFSLMVAQELGDLSYRELVLIEKNPTPPDDLGKKWKPTES